MKKEQIKFHCLKCGKYYTRKTSLENHRRYECGQKRTFSCIYCSYVGKLKHHLKNHMLNKHHCLIYKNE